MHKLAQTVLEYVRKQDLLRTGDRVGVAVSGGADSVALLRILLELRAELGIVLSVAHLNHKLRGAESDADEAFVRELAAVHGLEIVCESQDVKEHAAQNKLSLEAAAREVRYEFFREALADGLDRIATAHTLDDQAETVLMKLARGTGTRGLAGIYPKVAISSFDSAQGRLSPSAVRRVNSKSPEVTRHSALSTQHPAKVIFRPLLSIRRERLIEYLGELGQEWREDSSNRDLRHTRNRVRHGILPRLEEHVNPAVCEALAEAAEIARGEEEYWAGEIRRVLPVAWKRTGCCGVLSGVRVAEFDLALQRRVVKACAESLGLGLDFRHVEEVLALHDEGERASLPQDWTVSLHKGDLRFEPPSVGALDDEPVDYEYVLAVPGEVVVVEAGVMVKAARTDSASSGYNPQDFLKGEYASGRLVVRNWRAGERFWPAHTKEPKKIKELLQDRHITGDEKKRWPVVAHGEEIVWVRGLGVRRDLLAKNGSGVLIQDVSLQA